MRLLFFFFSDSSSCFNWESQVVDAGAGSLFWLCAATLQVLGNLHSGKKKKKRKAARAWWIPILNSHEVEQPFCSRLQSRQTWRWNINTGSSRTASPSLNIHHKLLSFFFFLYFLKSHFNKLFRFFFVLWFPSQGQMVLKTTKMNDQSQINVSFSRSTVPKSEQTQKPRGTNDISKYSIDWLGCANELHIETLNKLHKKNVSYD